MYVTVCELHAIVVPDTPHAFLFRDSQDYATAFLTLRRKTATKTRSQPKTIRALCGSRRQCTLVEFRQAEGWADLEGPLVDRDRVAVGAGVLEVQAVGGVRRHVRGS
jgi:hypothetical protein